MADEKDSKNKAHSRAVAKYNAKNYKTFSVNLKHDEHETLMLLMGRAGMGKSQLLKSLIEYAATTPEVEKWLKDKQKRNNDIIKSLDVPAAVTVGETIDKPVIVAKGVPQGSKGTIPKK